MTPVHVAVDESGDLFITDETNTRVRRVDSGTGTIMAAVETGNVGFTGDGDLATDASLNLPNAVHHTLRMC